MTTVCAFLDTFEHCTVDSHGRLGYMMVCIWLSPICYYSNWRYSSFFDLLRESVLSVHLPWFIFFPVSLCLASHLQISPSPFKWSVDPGTTSPNSPWLNIMMAKLLAVISVMCYMTLLLTAIEKITSSSMGGSQTLSSSTSYFSRCLLEPLLFPYVLATVDHRRQFNLSFCPRTNYHHENLLTSEKVQTRIGARSR